MKLHKKVLLIIFFLSGLSSLIYQVCWQRMLTLYFGVGFYSTTIIVSIYMLGLGIGAYYSGQKIDALKFNLAKGYGYIELLIGCFAVISPFLLHYFGEAFAGYNYFITTITISLFLLIPTMLMGATLPLLIKIIGKFENDFSSNLSLLYFINTIGAALGAIVASFLLIETWGLDGSIYIGAVINLFIGAVVFLLFKHIPKNNTDANLTIIRSKHSSLNNNLRYLIIFLSGFSAIGFEIIWFRIVGTLVKDSVYAFSSVLFVYLLGIGIGSYFYSLVSNYVKKLNQLSLYLYLQIGIVLYAITIILLMFELNKHSTTIHLLIQSSVNIDIHPNLYLKIDSLKSFLSFIDIIFWPIILFLPATVLMGFAFPLANQLLYEKDKEASSVGKTYFVNIIGNVLGGLTTGFLLIEFFNTIGSIIFITFFSIVYFIILFKQKVKSKIIFFTNIFLFTILFILIITVPNSADFYKILHPDYPNHTFTFDENKEGISASHYNHDELIHYINGTTHGSRPGYTYFSEVIETYSRSRDVKEVFVLGLGAASITEALVKPKQIEHIDLVEINGASIKNLSRLDTISKILNNPKLSVHIEDGRRFLLTNSKKYDMIFMDPLRTKTAYSNNIHSKEFFEIIKSRLTENGIVMIGGGMNDGFILKKTVHLIFKHVLVFDFYMIASEQPFIKDSKRQDEILACFNDETKSKINNLNIKQLYTNYQLDSLLSKENIDYNTDWAPKTEYYLLKDLRKK